jgi:hypothetical protein
MHISRQKSITSRSIKTTSALIVIIVYGKALFLVLRLRPAFIYVALSFSLAHPSRISPVAFSLSQVPFPCIRTGAGRDCRLVIYVSHTVKALD